MRRDRSVDKKYFFMKNNNNKFKTSYNLKKSFNYKEVRQRINNILNFTRNVLTNYKFEEDIRTRYFSEINKISRRNEDTDFYLGVLGEFSTGKSTFINAMIRDELLKKHVMSGTTAASTIIRYGPYIDVQVLFKNGKKEYFSKNNDFKDKKALISYLHKVTTVEEISKNVEEVIVYHPSSKLSKGLVIVDMPGLNSLESRHSEVTKNTVLEVCDAVIIVMHSVHHFTKSLEKFLQENLSDQIHRCIFIINQIDLVEERGDRNLVYDSVKESIINSFQLNKTMIYSVSSLSVFCDLNTMKEQEELKKDFVDMEESIMNILKQKRIYIQTEKTASFLMESIKDITKEIERFKESYHSMHEALLNTQVPDIRIFTNERKEKYSNSMKEFTVHIKVNMEDFLKIKQEELRKRITAEINTCSSKDELKKFIESIDSKCLEEIKKQIEKKLAYDISRIENHGTDMIEKFEEDFLSIYQSLKTLGGEINACDNYFNINGSNNIIATDSSSEIIGGLSQLIDNSKGKTGIGVGVGIALGIIFPGVGLILGAIFGGIVGRFFGKSLSNTKAECIQKLEASIGESFVKITSDCSAVIDNNSIQVNSDIEKITLNYIDAYIRLLSEMNERDKKMAEELLKLQNNAKLHIKRFEEESLWLSNLKADLIQQ